MRKSEALRYRQHIENAVQTLTDSDALEVIILYPEWAVGVDYPVGYKIHISGNLYHCLQAHTSQDGWDPENAPSLWAKVLIPDETVTPEWEQPDSTNAYMVGDKVTHNGKTWVSIVDNNVWEPGVYGREEAS